MKAEQFIKDYTNHCSNEMVFEDGSGSHLYEPAVLEEIFPELKESEDERIKESIIATIHLYYGEPLEDEAKDMIAWLEKQGEKKSQRMISAEAKEAMYDKPAWSEENEVRINRIVACLENLNVADNDILLKDVNWLKSLKQRIGG